MASSVIAGSVSAVLQTNHVVGTIVTAGVYVAKVDLGSLQNGDEVELRFADTCSFAGTLSVAYSATYAHVQGTQIKVSPPVPKPEPIPDNIRLALDRLLGDLTPEQKLQLLRELSEG